MKAQKLMIAVGALILLNGTSMAEKSHPRSGHNSSQEKLATPPADKNDGEPTPQEKEDNPQYQGIIVKPKNLKNY